MSETSDISGKCDPTGHAHPAGLGRATRPADADPVRWVLLTSERVETIEQARQIIAYYAQRWAVEEYHKALKTGCRVEARYYGTIARLQRVTGLLAIVAVQLLKLRSIAQHAPDHPLRRSCLPSGWRRCNAFAPAGVPAADKPRSLP